MWKVEGYNKSAWLGAFARFGRWIRARPSLVKLGQVNILIVVLLAPSVWMLSRIPPLWKDIDAYVQVTQPPGLGTILHYGPLYCFVARIPLYLGYAIDSVARGAPLPTASFFIHPTLTDSGVFALVLLQHISLCFATFHLFAVTTRLFWVRLMLAVAWAINPLFYTFANCIGNETLSVILVILIAATGLRILQYSRSVSGNEWLLFGVVISLCILTRHINATLPGLLPLTFLFISAYRLVMTRFARPRSLRRWQRLLTRQALQKATFAVAVGISCVVLANLSLRGLCYAAKTPYYSTVGFTFLFRLKFLARLPVEKRNQLLDKVTGNTNSTDVKKLVSLLRNSFRDESPNWDVMAFNKEAQASLLTSQTDQREERFYLALNSTAKAFLCPPQGIFLNAVRIDFTRSQQITIPDIVGFLFVTTRFYFSHAAAMPQCTSLVTFHHKNAGQIFAIFRTHSYFRHPKDVSYRALLFFWLINLALFIVIAKVRKREAAGLASYAVALTVTGLFMMFANCFLTVFQPRFTLPMWELTIISLSILSAKTLEYILAGRKQLREAVLG